MQQVMNEVTATAWVDVKISNPRFSLAVKSQLQEIRSQCISIERSWNLSKYIMSICTLLIPPKSKLCSWEGKTGFRIFTKIGGLERSILFTAFSLRFLRSGTARSTHPTTGTHRITWDPPCRLSVIQSRRNNCNWKSITKWILAAGWGWIDGLVCGEWVDDTLVLLSLERIFMEI
jgi:hypothetical protein